MEQDPPTSALQGMESRPLLKWPALDGVIVSIRFAQLLPARAVKKRKIPRTRGESWELRPTFESHERMLR